MAVGELPDVAQGFVDDLTAHHEWEGDWPEVRCQEGSWKDIDPMTIAIFTAKVQLDTLEALKESGALPYTAYPMLDSRIARLERRIEQLESEDEL